MTPDSLSQFSQATGLTAYSDHHPLLHTLLFEALYRIGFFLTRNVYMGIAAYTLFQMAVLAGVETFCLSVLSRLGATRLLLSLLQSVEAASIPLCLQQSGLTASEALSVYGTFASLGL